MLTDIISYEKSECVPVVAQAALRDTQHLQQIGNAQSPGRLTNVSCWQEDTTVMVLDTGHTMIELVEPLGDGCNDSADFQDFYQDITNTAIVVWLTHERHNQMKNFQDQCSRSSFCWHQCIDSRPDRIAI